MTNKWTRFILTIIPILLFGFLCIHTNVHAQEFPEREPGQVVLDPDNLFPQPEKTNLEEYITSLPHEYILVFLEKLEEDGFAYTKKLFDFYRLEANSILFVISTEEPGHLFYAYGNNLVEKGLTDQAIQEREETFFKSFAREENYLTGVSQLINSLELEIENLEMKKAREQELTIYEQVDETEPVEKEDSFTLPGWIMILSILFVLIVMILLVSFVYRRKITRQVDQLEAWKIEIENRPFSSQLARIKGLKLAGETEAQFEKWRAEWEEILNTTLPNIEETLIDIEEEADRYRFFRAKRMIERTEQRLTEIEASLDRIVSEIDELTSNERHNRELVAKLHEQYQVLKVALHKNSLALGISYAIWFEKFKKTTEWFEEFNQAQEGGDYLRAKDLLEAIESVFEQIDEAIKLTPELVKQIEQDVPEQLREVELAIQEMKDKGYLIEHLGVEDKWQELTTNKQEIVSYMEKGQIGKMKAWLEQFNRAIEDIYASFEEEVASKAYVLGMMKELPNLMKELREKHDFMIYESNKTKQSYTWDEDWEEELNRLKKQFKELESLSTKLTISEEELAATYPTIKPDLLRFEEKRDQWLESMHAFEAQLNKLREEELQSIEQLKQLKQTMIQIKVNLRKSNLPGIPDHLQSGLDLAEEAIRELEIKLAEVPVHMHKIQHQLQETKSQVESVAQVATSVISHAQRAEQLIPFANRYRRSHQEINIMLLEAEDAFRNLQFREAVELVEEALDLGDKNWREKLEDEDFAV